MGLAVGLRVRIRLRISPVRSFFDEKGRFVKSLTPPVPCNGRVTDSARVRVRVRVKVSRVFQFFTLFRVNDRGFRIGRGRMQVMELA